MSDSNGRGEPGGRERRRVRATLARRGLRAHKARGQNFLVDRRVAEQIADWARLGPGDTAIEVGPGLGILTRALASRARRVIAIEIDRGLVEALRAEGGLPDHVELRHGDALDVDLAALAQGVEGPTHLVANLPYSISAPLLRWLLSGREALQSWVVMLQREVAERLVAEVGSRTYSSLSALYQAGVQVERLGVVPGESFDPIPQVESVVVRCEPIRPAPMTNEELDDFEALVRACFSARRKTLINSLRAKWPWGAVPDRASLEGHLERAGIAPRSRAETVSPAQFGALVRSLRGTFEP